MTMVECWKAFQMSKPTFVESYAVYLSLRRCHIVRLSPEPAGGWRPRVVCRQPWLGSEIRPQVCSGFSSLPARAAIFSFQVRPRAII
jgi:hypothetical protein